MSRGDDRERAVQDLLQDEDWWVGRITGGAVDLVAAKGPTQTFFGRYCRRLLFVQVKSTAGGPYERFEPKKRADLIFAARLAGAEAWLAWHPPRGKLRWFSEAEWPDSMGTAAAREAAEEEVVA